MLFELLIRFGRLYSEVEHDLDALFFAFMSFFLSGGERDSRYLMEREGEGRIIVKRLNLHQLSVGSVLVLLKGRRLDGKPEQRDRRISIIDG